MKYIRSISLCIWFAIVLSASVVNAFDMGPEYWAWIHDYRKTAISDRVLESIVALPIVVSVSNDLDKNILRGFYGKLLSDNPSHFDEWIQAVINTNDAKTCELIAEACWLFLGKVPAELLATLKDNRLWSASLQSLQPIDILLWSPQKPEDIGYYWGAYYASGKSAYIMKLCDLFNMQIKDFGDKKLNQMLLKNTAIYSVIMNRNDPDVSAVIESKVDEYYRPLPACRSKVEEGAFGTLNGWVCPSRDLQFTNKWYDGDSLLEFGKKAVDTVSLGEPITFAYIAVSPKLDKSTYKISYTSEFISTSGNRESILPAKHYNQRGVLWGPLKAILLGPSWEIAFWNPRDTGKILVVTQFKDRIGKANHFDSLYLYIRPSKRALRVITNKAGRLITVRDSSSDSETVFKHSFYPSGYLKSSQKFKGNYVLSETKYFNNGRINQHRDYDSTGITLKYRLWAKNGNPKIDINYNSLGQRHGSYVAWFSNGVKMDSIDYYYGSPGITHVWYPTGVLKYYAESSKGVPFYGANFAENGVLLGYIKPIFPGE